MGKGACIQYMSTPKLRGDGGGLQAYAGRYGSLVGSTLKNWNLALATIYLPFLSASN